MSASVQPGYRSPLRLPNVATFFSFALVGRLAYGTGTLALILQVQHSTGSYAEAGTALACYGLAVALLSPLRGRAIDRYGLRRVLPLLALGYSAALLAIAFSGALGGWLIAISAMAGVVAPPLGPTTRRVWSDVAADPQLLRRAYSLDTVAEEILFTLGPVLTGLVAGLTDPAVALLLTTVVLLVGTFGMVASPLSRLPDLPATDRGSRPLSRPAFRQLLLVLTCVGIGLGSIDLAVVSTAQHHGGAAATGVLLAMLSLGSVIGGTAYGHRSWRLPAARQLVVVVGLLAVSLTLLAAPRSLVLLGLCLFLSGFCIAPTLIIGFTRSDELTDAANRTEAGTWLNSSLNLGISAGTAVSGFVVTRHGGGPALLIGAAAMAGAALLARPASNH